MYLVDTFDGDALKFKALNKPPFGPGFTEEQIGDAVKLELWGTQMTDAGPDCNEFRLLDKDGNVLASKRIEGY